MPNVPEFHFRVPPRKIERVVKPVWDYPTIDRITEHLMDNKQMSPYQISLHDTNKDGFLTIDEMIFAIITINSLTVISVTPALNEQAGQKKGYLIGASTPGGTIGGGGGGSGGY